MNQDEIYNCLVIDDEYLGRKLLSEYISKVPQLRLAGSFDNPVDALNILSSGKISILFLDIEMADISGIYFIKHLNHPEKPLVIFVTAYPQYASQGFEVDAIEYLIKPATYTRFIKAVQKAINILNLHKKASLFDRNLHCADTPEPHSGSNYLIVKSERRMVKLHYDDIYFIEGAMEYVNFQTKNKKIMGLYSLKKLEEELPGEKFMRIHKSYIVALDKIREIDGNRVKTGEWTIYVSKANRARLIQLFSEH
ncbi:MAG: LytR/AlgR family response regulator transcription factor [Mangrovibacterium sp.]